MQTHSLRGLLGTMSIAAAIVATGIVATGARADDDEKRFGEEVLDILREEGRISQERYEELKEKEAAEARAADDDWTIRYSNGMKFDKNDGSVKFGIGGRIQADFASIHPENDLNRVVPGGDGEGVEFRRARFYMEGEFYERIIFKSQIDFATGSVVIDDMYIGMTDLGCLGTAKVGHFKEPYSLEELTSSKYITFMERALPAVFDSSRNFGLGFQNAILDERVTWATGIFAPSNSDGFYFSGDANFDIQSRVTALPLYADGGRQLIHLGFSGGYEVRDDTTGRFRQRPEMHLAQRYVDTGDYQTDGNGLLSAEVAAVFGPVHMSSEYKYAAINQVDGKDLNVYGGYVQAGWFLTGESRPYKKAIGTWARVKPANPFDPDQGRWGAFELAARYSYLNLNSHDLNGGKEQDVTVALNWYLYSNVRLSTNFVYADVRSTGDNLGNARGAVYGAQARAQLEF